MQIDFYHLAATPPERIVSVFARRILASGGRLLVIAGNTAEAEALDAGLWTCAPESFVPHGIAGQGGEADQPILISLAAEATNGARHVAVTDGVWRDAMFGFDRAFYLFDDRSIAGARQAWRDLAGREDIDRNFWKQDDAGRWEKAA